MEEPEEYVVEEKLHFISKRVEAEPAKGRPALKLILTLCEFGLSHFLCSFVVNLLSALQMWITVAST